MIDRLLPGIGHWYWCSWESHLNGWKGGKAGIAAQYAHMQWKITHGYVWPPLVSSSMKPSMGLNYLLLKPCWRSAISLTFKAPHKLLDPRQKVIHKKNVKEKRGKCSECPYGVKNLEAWNSTSSSCLELMVIADPDYFCDPVRRDAMGWTIRKHPQDLPHEDAQVVLPSSSVQGTKRTPQLVFFPNGFYLWRWRSMKFEDETIVE